MNPFHFSRFRSGFWFRIGGRGLLIAKRNITPGSCSLWNQRSFKIGKYVVKYLSKNTWGE